MIRNLPGTDIGDRASGSRIYTPPQGAELITNHLRKWEAFLHADHGLDPLVAMALAHYQFEAIHPFFDFNGRTRRVLNMLMLIESKLLELPVPYLSGHIMRHNKDECYERLDAVTSQEEWQEWVLFILAANPKLPAAELTRLLFTHPYVRIDNVVEADLAQRQTASKWLTELAGRGLISKEKVGRRIVNVNLELLDQLIRTPLPS